MALCLAQSLLTQQKFDPVDQMNRYCQWHETGYMSSTGHCFDIGVTVLNALRRYQKTGEPFAGSKGKFTAGNGSLMRLAPIPVFYHDNLDECVKYAGESSRTTHANPECIECCQLFASLIFWAFRASSKRDIFKLNNYRPCAAKVLSIANLGFLEQDYSDLTGSGYVMESLESALWCFFNGSSFRECILLAANLGNDADTTAAICGQIAGAYYGLCGIPKKWRQTIFMGPEIERLSQSLSQLRRKQ